MEAGARLAYWHLTEARRFLGEVAMPPEQANPAKLDAWMLDYCRRAQTDIVPTREILRGGPNGLRSKDALNDAVAELVDHGRCRLVTDGKKRSIQINPALLEVSP